MKWFDQFKKGFVTAFTICSVIGVVGIFFFDKIIVLKNAEITRLNNEFSRLSDYSEKFHKEEVKRKQCEISYSKSESLLNDLLKKKWEEKYQSEKLKRQALEENVSILTERIKGIRDEEIPKESCEKEKSEIFLLRDQLKISQQELKKLRNFYTTERKRNNALPSPNPKPLEADLTHYKMVRAGIKGMISSDISSFISSSYSGSKNKLNYTQLSTLVSGMISDDIAQTIKNIAGNITNDGNTEAVKSILRHLISSDQNMVMKILVNSPKS